MFWHFKKIIGDDEDLEMDTKVNTTDMFYASFLLSIGFKFEKAEIEFINGNPRVRYIINNNDTELQGFFYKRYVKGKYHKTKFMKNFEFIRNEVVKLLEVLQNENNTEKVKNDENL